MKRVLFIGHDASRTGAPIVLLNFLRWLKENGEVSFEILLKQDGELRREYEALGTVWVLNEPTRFYQNALTRAGNRLHTKISDQLLLGRLARSNVDLVYSNTIENWEILRRLGVLKCPVISHVHELEYWIRFQTRPENFQYVKDRTDYYVAASRAVKENLVQNHQIPEDKVEVIHEFVPTAASSQEQRENVRQRVRRELGIPADAVIIGGVGTVDWRKGTDLFVRLAHSVLKRQPDTPVFFIWIGGEKEGAAYGALWLDLVNWGLEKYVKFLGVQANPLDFILALDIFALTSREDPFPLAMLEAASLAKPIVCFDKSGGASEFVDDVCGFVVPYADVDAMADKLLLLLTSPELCASLGSAAEERVRAQHDVLVGAPRLYNVIRRALMANIV